MKLPHKAFLLTELVRYEKTWDQRIIDAAKTEYGLTGAYWTNHFSLTLEDLASAGLIERLDNRLDKTTGRLEFQYALTDFGRQRMIETSLI